MIEDARLEVRVHDILTAVALGQKIEHDYVDVKGDWPLDGPEKRARQLAGMLNAARGQDVLWVIGASEATNEIRGASNIELRKWWGPIASWFVNPPARPRLRPINYTNGNTVAALVFRGDSQEPFLVKVPRIDSTGKAIRTERFEIPWRDGDEGRSASRAEVLQILVPRAAAPKFHVLFGYTSCDDRQGPLRWRMNLQLYVELPPGQPLVIPDFTITARLILDGLPEVPLRAAKLRPRFRKASDAPPPPPTPLTQNDAMFAAFSPPPDEGQLTLAGPAPVTFTASGDDVAEAIGGASGETLIAIIEYRPVLETEPHSMRLGFTWRDRSKTDAAGWYASPGQHT